MEKAAHLLGDDVAEKETHQDVNGRFSRQGLLSDKSKSLVFTPILTKLKQPRNKPLRANDG